jgi:Asp/Glu/hydantoin racemase
VNGKPPEGRLSERETLADLGDNITRAAADAMSKALAMTQAANVLAAAIAFHDWTLVQNQRQFSAHEVVGFFLSYGKSIVNLDD